MEKKQWLKRVGWFWLAIAILSVGKALLVWGLPIYPIPTAACDDALMKNWALQIANGAWTGPFSCYIFTKEVGFAIYLALTYRLHLPYILATNLLYMAGAAILAYAASHVVKQKWALCLIYGVILYHPIMTAVQTGQRVYRNGFAVALTLWAVGSLLNLYFEIGVKPLRYPILWSFLAAGSLGFLWITKSDTIWLMPFTIVVLCISSVLLIRQYRNWKVLGRAALLVIPLIGVSLFPKLVIMKNERAYGLSGVPYYGEALHLLTHIDAEGVTENISLPTQLFRELCQLSPTLASTEERVLRVMEEYDPYDTHPKDGNVENGWIGWALVRGFQRAGYYQSSQTASDFYKKVYEELSAAVEEGKIRLKESPPGAGYHVSTAQERKELLATIGEICSYVVSHDELFSDAYLLGEKEIVGSQSFELVTRNNACYADFNKDYACVGWVLYPQHDLAGMDCYIEDAAGNRLAQIEFEKSWDVRHAYPDIKGARRCRFQVEWSYNGEEAQPEFYLAGYEGGRQVGKVKVSKLGMEGAPEDVCIGSVDGYFAKAEEQRVTARAQKAASRCNLVYGLYHAAGKWMAWAGLLAYAGFTVLAVWEWFGRKFQNVNAWLVVTGIGLSLLVLFAGVAVTHLENCPAIGYMYLSAAYPLLSLISLVSLAKCGECVKARFFGKKP